MICSVCSGDRLVFVSRYGSSTPRALCTGCRPVAARLFLAWLAERAGHIVTAAKIRERGLFETTGPT